MTHNSANQLHRIATGDQGECQNAQNYTFHEFIRFLHKFQFLILSNNRPISVRKDTFFWMDASGIA